jgi:hypothetical protein
MPWDKRDQGRNGKGVSRTVRRLRFHAWASSLTKTFLTTKCFWQKQKTQSSKVLQFACKFPLFLKHDRYLALVFCILDCTLITPISGLNSALLCKAARRRRRVWFTLTCGFCKNFRICSSLPVNAISNSSSRKRISIGHGPKPTDLLNLASNLADSRCTRNC